VTTALAVGAGALGALARYEAGGLVQRVTASERPWGTLAVNVSGALALGLLAGLRLEGALDPDVYRVAGMGFLGAYTTFSTWMLESVRLAGDGGRAGLVAAAVNIGGMLVVGLLAVWAGLALGRLA
jgi:CrcB protein